MRVCLGGTFDPFHAGHEALLRAACADAEHVFVGITQGTLSEREGRTVGDWQARADAVTAFVKSIGFANDLTVRALDDAIGPAATEDYDAIAVSPETVEGAMAINGLREQNRLKPLAIRRVPHVLAEDLLPISGTRIAAGAIDRDGKRLTPVKVAVGSGNPVKVDGVRMAMERILPDLELDVSGESVDPGVPEQPKGDEIQAGAATRANAALDANVDADYAIGVEAGLHTDDDGRHYDVQCAVVVDPSGTTTTGWGPAFQYPEWVTKRALAGEMVSDIIGPIANDDHIGGTTGAIGFLTDGRYMRTEFTEQAVVMAFVPRIRRDLYLAQPSQVPAND